MATVNCPDCSKRLKKVAAVSLVCALVFSFPIAGCSSAPAENASEAKQTEDGLKLSKGSIAKLADLDIYLKTLNPKSDLAAEAEIQVYRETCQDLIANTTRYSESDAEFTIEYVEGKIQESELCKFETAATKSISVSRKR
ncbi:MAG: hypothetical protein RSB04_07810 [Gordonibacter sp.]|uniref:hypothetical protein n=1 Tax=Gordonibacter sp. TaxID=1968902 RepID=UPI002FCACF41